MIKKTILILTLLCGNHRAFSALAAPLKLSNREVATARMADQLFPPEVLKIIVGYSHSWQTEPIKTFKTQASTIVALDQTCFVSATNDDTRDNNKVHVWDRNNNDQPIKTFDCNGSIVTCLQHVDNNRFLVGGNRGSLALCNKLANIPVEFFQSHNNREVTALVLLQNDYFVSSSKDRTVKLRKIGTPEAVHTFNYNAPVLCMIAFDDDTVVTGCDNGLLVLLRKNSPQAERIYTTGQTPINGLKGIDANTFVSASNWYVTMWNKNSPTAITTFMEASGPINTLAVVDGNHIAAGCEDESHGLVVWNTAQPTNPIRKDFTPITGWSRRSWLPANFCSDESHRPSSPSDAIASMLVFDNNTIITGGKNGQVLLHLLTPDPDAVTRLTTDIKHSYEITSLTKIDEHSFIAGGTGNTTWLYSRQHPLTNLMAEYRKHKKEYDERENNDEDECRCILDLIANFHKTFKDFLPF